MNAGLAAGTGCTMCRLRAAITARAIIAAILLALAAAAVFSSQTLANAAGPPTISSPPVEPLMISWSTSGLIELSPAADGSSKTSETMSRLTSFVTVNQGFSG